MGPDNGAAVRVVGEGSVIEEGASLAVIETEHEAHRGGLARPVGPEESGDDAIGHGETQVFNGT